MDLAYPWMLLGLLGLPTLAAIYWLRSRSQLRVVSSLIFWSDQRNPRQGGRIVQRLQTPLTFFLELLAITAIVLAAAGLSITNRQFVRPIVIVLDDSFSMTAGGEDSPRHRGGKAVAEELRGTDYLARFVLAGARPRLLADSLRSAAPLPQVLEQWTCAAPTAALEQAIAMAAEVGGPAARILVISDHAPATEPPQGKVVWKAFGRATSNIAFTAAARNATIGEKRGAEDRVLLEVTNFGREPAHTQLVVQGADLAAPRQSPLNLRPGEASRFFLNLPRGSGPLRAKLEDDALAADNEVVLLSPRHHMLRVQLAVSDVGDSTGGGLRTPLTRALEASGQATLVTSRPDLVITDGAANPSDAWQLQFVHGGEPVSFSGPFVLDLSCPLTEGLSLEAVIWTAGGKAAPTGAPIVAAGNTLLLADRQDAAGRHMLQMALEPKLSNFTDIPDWPILIANLVRWRLASLPGCAETNVRLGQNVRISLSDEAAKEAVVILPNSAEQTVPIHGRQLDIQADHLGLHNVHVGTSQHEFACNALSAEESNLTTCATGQWGDWNQSQIFQDQRMSLTWIFILLAIACLALHMELLHRAGGAQT